MLEIGLLQGAMVRRRLADYVALTKPRVVVMVLITTLVGYHLGADGHAHLAGLLITPVAEACALRARAMAAMVRGSVMDRTSTPWPSRRGAPTVDPRRCTCLALDQDPDPAAECSGS